MSHHFDTPTAFADGRINLCDLHVSLWPWQRRIHPDRESRRRAIIAGLLIAAGAITGTRT